MPTEFQELKDHISQMPDDVFLSQYASKLQDYNGEVQVHILREVGTRGLDPEVVERHRQAELARTNEERKTKLTGLGGWLVLYIISAVIGLFANTGQIINEGLESFISMPVGWLLLLSVALQLTALLLLLLKSRLTSAFALITCGAYVLIALYSFWILREIGDPAVLFTPGRTLVVSALWAGYFLKSERVRFTFGPRIEGRVDGSV